MKLLKEYKLAQWDFLAIWNSKNPRQKLWRRTLKMHITRVSVVLALNSIGSQPSGGVFELNLISGDIAWKREIKKLPTFGIPRHCLRSAEGRPGPARAPL